MDQLLEANTPRKLHLWVDADACPVVIKDMMFRAADRLNLPLTMVANQLIRTPPSPNIRAIQVSHGFDEADHWIVEQVQQGDLVITADIPLAARVIEKSAWALNPRGEFYSPENIRERLNMRDFMEELRGAGLQSGGPAAFSQADKQAFGQALDRFLAKNIKK